MPMKSYVLWPVEKLSRVAGYLAGAGVISGDGKTIVDGKEQEIPGLYGKIYDGLEGIEEVGQAIYNSARIAYDVLTDIAFSKGLQEYTPVLTEWIKQSSDHFNNFINYIISIGNDFGEFSERTAVALGFVAAGYLLSELIDFYRTDGRGSYMTRLKRRLGQRIKPESPFD